MDSDRQDIVPRPALLQVFSLSALLVWLSVLAQWANAERLWENTQRSRWKKLCFCEHVSGSERDKGKHSFLRGWCWGGRRGCTVKTAKPQGPCGGARRRALRSRWCLCYAPSRLESKQSRSEMLPHLSNPQVFWDSLIWAREQALHHPSPWRQNLQVTVVLYAWNKTVTETLTQLFQVMWEKAEMEVQDSGLIRFSTLNFHTDELGDRGATIKQYSRWQNFRAKYCIFILLENTTRKQKIWH